jgi:hypothetical protein
MADASIDTRASLAEATPHGKKPITAIKRMMLEEMDINGTRGASRTQAAAGQLRAIFYIHGDLGQQVF